MAPRPSPLTALSRRCLRTSSQHTGTSFLDCAYQQSRTKATTSTSALAYKAVHRRSPLPLPVVETLPSYGAAAAVSSILYETPIISHAPPKKHVLNCLVQNEPGVLSRVSGILAARGFNIDSLVVCNTEVEDLSRMTIVLQGQDGVVEQARRQLEDLVPVWAVLDYTSAALVQRELLLAKISILGPEVYEELMEHHRDITNFSNQAAEDTEQAEELEANSDKVGLVEQAKEILGQGASYHPKRLATSQALRHKHEHLAAITQLAHQFGGKVVDISTNNCIVEVSAKPSRIDSFMKLIAPFGILESSRTGLMALPRSPLYGPNEELQREADEVGYLLLWTPVRDLQQMGKTSGSSKYNLPGRPAWMGAEIVGPINLLFLLYALPRTYSTVQSRSPTSILGTGLPAERELLGLLYLVHYLNRAVITPLLAPSMSPMHALIASLMSVFQLVNSSSIACWIVYAGTGTGTGAAGQDSQQADSSVIARALGIIGLGLFAAGLAGNIYAEHQLFSMRRAAAKRKARSEGKAIVTYDKVYVIPPAEGPFKRILYPHYVFEWLEWTGYWILGGALGLGWGSQSAALWFVVNEVMSMLPRAVNGKAWYEHKFGKRAVGGRAGAIPLLRFSVLGFPRIGANRELKKATEAYWNGKLSQEELLKTGKQLRLAHWKLQKDAGVDIIPSNDFAFYDQVLDHIQLFGVVPERYTKYKLDPIDEYFALGRGLQKPEEGIDVPSLEMVKWFDSNYHYVKPTLQDNQTFQLSSNPKPVVQFNEAKEAGIVTRPVLLGPVSFLALGKADRGQSIEPITALDRLLPLYVDLIKQLKAAGAETIQIDEPVLVFDLAQNIKDAFKPAYEALSTAGANLVVATYFGDIVHNLDAVEALKGQYGLHIDLVRNPEQLETVIGALGPKQILSAGVVDGRNIWKTNFKRAIELVETAIQKLGKDRVIVATSSSLLHTPHTLTSEKSLDPEIADWFSFAVEKLTEVATISKAVTDGPASVQSALEANAKSWQARTSSKRTNDQKVQERQRQVTEEQHNRKSAFPVRISKQQERLHLPLFPTTTIGSFPQTKDIRIQRQKFTKGEITEEQYEKFIEKEIQDVVKIQEELDLDVLVHGEPERNDMVQYFGERLNGYAFTTNGWVQSYGSRCVRPPIIVGDISRPKPITVKESQYAASISKKPMKGMLTGPITCLRWSFPRDDVHQSVQAQQLALALRDEVVDLEKAGVYVIQVDEPALREGLPLRAGKERTDYLKWAVDSFRLATAGVEDGTQIHSHFCYSEFQDFFYAIAALDADVLSIENSKSDAKLLRVFVDEAYPRHIGPGVYDIHSPRIPSEEEIKNRIAEMLQYLKPDQLWIDPDCGLKTRQWKETKAALTNMVNAAKFYREKYSKEQQTQ
ncbi:hypothetical protein DV735_g2037, partial [Chaetothyriales sp. CBS 134920]